MRRSDFFGGVSALALAAAAPAQAAAATSFSDALAAIERSTGGRLGVFAIDTNSGKTLGYRPHERFLMCSTFKLPLAAMVLRKIDLGVESFSRQIPYSSADLLENAPVARQNVARGYVTVREALAAAIRVSDNTAANLLLTSVGGPSGYTKGLRQLGDTETILAHYEPRMSEAARAGQTGDMTTPSAMAYDARDMVIGDKYLQEKTRGLLQRWLIECQTGLNLIRAGFPKNWTAGDKTGMGGGHTAYGDSNTRNDIAFGWAPSGAPIIVTAYLTGVTVRANARDAALASVGRIVSSTLRP